MIQKSEFFAQDGSPVRLVYDEEADILEIFFGENGSATGVELTEHILMRLDVQARRPLSLLIRHFSILTEQTEYGPRSFSLENLDHLPDGSRELALHLMRSSPVSQFLRLSHLQTSTAEKQPVIFIEPHPFVALTP